MEAITVFFGSRDLGPNKLWISVAETQTADKMKQPLISPLERERQRDEVRAEIVGWRRRYGDREIIVYEIEVYCGGLAWHVERSYEDFVALERQLHAGLPAFWSRNAIAYGTVSRLGARFASTGAAVASERLPGLAAYLSEVTRTGGREVLKFLGAARASTAARETVHVRRLASLVSSGDLVLFRSRETISAVQRAVTGSDWDHVAVVVQSKATPALKLLLEATSDGVSVLPVAARVSGYDACRVAVRRLRAPDDPGKRLELMADFADAVRGQHYGFTLAALLDGVAYRLNPTWCVPPPPPDKPPNKRELFGCACAFVSPREGDSPAPPKHFCSELVALVLQRVGVIRDDVQADCFWPGSFAAGRLENFLADGFSYGSEIDVDTRLLEVANSGANVIVRPSFSSEGDQDEPRLSHIAIRPKRRWAHRRGVSFDASADVAGATKSPPRRRVATGDYPLHRNTYGRSCPNFRRDLDYFVPRSKSLT